MSRKITSILNVVLFFMPGFLTAADIGVIKIQGPHRIRLPYDDIGWVIHAVEVGGRYLAVVYGRAQTKDRIKSLYENQGAPNYIAPAWFDKGWQLIQLGEPVKTHGDLLFMNFTPSGGIIDYRPLPQVAVLQPLDEECPFIWFTALEIKCLNSELSFVDKMNTPILARGFLVFNGQILMKGVYNGALLHSVDWENQKFSIPTLTIDQIRTALKDAKVPFDEKDFSVNEPKKLEKEDENTQKTIPTPLRLSRSFNFDLVFSKNRVILTLQRPLVVLSWKWPSLEDVKVWTIQKENLPPWVHNFEDLQLVQSYPWKGGILNFYQLRRGVTYKEYISLNPGRVKQIQEEWRQQHPDEPLTESTIVSEESRELFVHIQQNGEIRVYDRIEWGSELSDPAWAYFLTVPFQIRDKFFWTLLRREGQRTLSAVASMELD